MDFELIASAYKRGDIDAVRDALGNPADFPNTMDEFRGTCLCEALYHSPIRLVRALLELGADPNYDTRDGFPALFTALSTAQPDRCERVALLLDFGADIHQRGVNDYTPLHFAATRDDSAAIALLLGHGADPALRTRIDHHATPLEEAEYFGHRSGAETLRKLGVTS